MLSQLAVWCVINSGREGTLKKLFPINSNDKRSCHNFLFEPAGQTLTKMSTFRVKVGKAISFIG